MREQHLSAYLGDLSERPIHLEEVLRRIVDRATNELDADRGTLYLLDQARQELISRVAHLPEIAEIRVHLGEGEAGTVAATGRPRRTHLGGATSRQSQRVDQLTGYATHSLLTVPLHREGHPIGVLQLLNQAEGRFTADHEARLQGFAEEVVDILDTTSLGSQLHAGNPHPLAFRFNHIVGESGAMQTVYDRIHRAAPTDVTVLIRGETGTGKELVARAIHHNSPRRDAPLVKVDCAALPEALIENELFGHERGAYTGATERAEGKVHAAKGGTLFLDEIGELTLPVQGRLLRLLQDRAFLRVGSHTPESADVRFVCATHRDLEAKVADGSFRQDLYYRLRVVCIDTPPLRKRGHADLDRLIDYFLFASAKRHHRPASSLTSRARVHLHTWHWPGNVRELQNCLESAVVLAPGPKIDVQDLSLIDLPGQEDVYRIGLVPYAEMERGYLEWALDQHGGNRTKTALALGIGRNTLSRKLS